MIEVEVANRSGVEVEEEAAAELARRVLAAEGIEDGELGIAFVGPEESRALKREHSGSTRRPTCSRSRSTAATAARGRAAPAR